MKRKSPPPAPVSAAAERAALLGREFPLALLRTSRVDESEIAEQFDSGLWVQGGHPALACFGNPVAARKILKSIPWSRRRDHHLALGNAALQLRLPPQEVAAHFEAAQQFPQARAQWLKAGECACANGNYRPALGWIRRALAIWPWDDAPSDRVLVLREMARCATNARDSGSAREAWEELAGFALESGRHPLRVDALHELAALLTDPSKAGPLLLEAAEIAGRELSPAEAYRHWMGYVDFLGHRVRIHAAGQAFVHAEESARKSGDPAILSEMLGWKGLLAALAGEPENASLLVDESMRVAIEHQLPEQTATAYRRRANIADYAGNYEAEKQNQGIAIRYCRDTGIGGEVVCMSCLAYACFRTGDWKDALTTAREVLAENELHRGLAAIADCVCGMVAAFRGERRPARHHLLTAIRNLRAEGMVHLEFFALWATAYGHECDGEIAAATATYDEIRALWRETDDLHDSVPGLLFAGAHYADAGHPDRLGDCIDIFGKILLRSSLPEVRAASLALAAEQSMLEGNSAEASRLFNEAIALIDTAKLPLERVWLGCRKKHHGLEDPSDREILDIATRLGLRPMLANLRSCGSTTGDLTPRQCEVLRFLADGLTSKEIGDRLSLSTRTVEMHVGRLLQRLDCRTRPEAVRLAASRGWLR
ncbi:MAG: helix-turn-helix transcriptional regulator [Verrucomicrobiota bacterium]